MALPLKNGADLYNFEMLRARLHNISAQPTSTDVGLGQIYFNTGSNTAASLRIGYCYETGATPKFHHLATLVDIEDLQNQIDNIDFASSEEFTSLKKRVDAFLDGEVDSDAVLDNLKEIQAFLDNYDGATSLVDLLATKADKATTLDGYGITDAYTKGEVSNLLSDKANVTMVVRYQNSSWGSSFAQKKTYYPSVLVGYSSSEDEGVTGDYGILNIPTWVSNAESSYYAFQIYSTPGSSNLYWRSVTASSNGDWYKILDTNNYASVLGTVYAPYNSAGYLPLTGGSLTGQVKITTNDWGQQFILNSTSSSSGIRFEINGTLSGILRSTNSSNLQWYIAEGVDHILLHSGNITNYTAGAAYKLTNPDTNVTIVKTAGTSNIAILNTESISANVDYIHLYVTGGTNNARPLVLQEGYGNVGIGTTSPAYKLDVWGTGRFTDTLYGEKQITTDVGFIIKSSGTYNKASFSHSSNTFYIQSGYSDGSEVSGNVLISGVNTNNLTSFRVNAVYSSFNSRLLVGGATDNSAYALNVNGTAWFYTNKSYAHLTADNVGLYSGLFYGGYTASDAVLAASSIVLRGNVIIKSDNTLKVGDATISWDSVNSVLKVDKDFASDGQVSSGGIADEAASGGSGLEKVVFTLEAGQTSYECEHNLATREITVSIYEEGDDYQQVLTDVYLDDANTARIVFGSATDVAHKVVIVG